MAAREYLRLLLRSRWMPYSRFEPRSICAMAVGQRHQRRDEAHDEGDLAAATALRQAAGDRLLERVGAATGQDRQDRLTEGLGRLLRADGRRQTDEGDEQGDQREHELEGQGPRVGEAVPVAQPAEGVGQQAPQAHPADRGAGVVRRQLLLPEAAVSGTVGGRAHRFSSGWSRGTGRRQRRVDLCDEGGAVVDQVAVDLPGSACRMVTRHAGGPEQVEPAVGLVPAGQPRATRTDPVLRRSAARRARRRARRRRASRRAAAPIRPAAGRRCRSARSEPCGARAPGRRP